MHGSPLRAVPLRLRVLATVSLSCAALTATQVVDPATAAPINGFAAMGASETQGTAHSGSWVPWLAIDRGLNFGPSQSYNKAVGGSTTTTLLSGGQHTKVAGLVNSGDVDLSYLFIGGLDVPPVAADILAGKLNVPVWADGVVGRILTAVDTVMDENPVGMIVSGLPDMSLVPGAASYKAFAQPVVDAIDLVNAKLKTEILARNLVYIDVAGAMRDLNAAPLVVGGVTINVTTGSSNPTHFFVDNIHPGTVGNGYFANLMLTALNEGYGTNYALFTDAAILARAGLSGSYKGETSSIDYTQYIYFNPVPEPATVVLLGVAVLAVGPRVLRDVLRRPARRC